MGAKIAYLFLAALNTASALTHWPVDNSSFGSFILLLVNKTLIHG